MRSCLEFDQNIIDALSKLEMPLKNSKGIDIVFDKRKRNESLFEHIAKKSHQLKIRDIQIIPTILKNKNSEYKDKKSKKFKTYYGKRLGNNKKSYLKIITKITSYKTELITTIYTVRRKE